MSKTKITTPVEGFSGVGAAGVVFDNGVGYTDDESALAYFRSAGYGVGSEKPAELDVEPPVDARDVAEPEVVGTRLRDAAVDPRPEDFLPPTNAGKADPHGPLVVAPGIHAIETQVVRPGVVHVDDLDAQQAAETEQATRLLVDNEPVGDVTAAPADADRGPLGLSDPGSADVGKADAKDVRKAEKAADADAPAPAKKTAAKKTTAAKRS